MPSPTKKLRQRVSAAIEWRVRDAVAAALPPGGAAAVSETTLLANETAQIRVYMSELSASLADQQRALTLIVEALERRVAALERSD